MSEAAANHTDPALHRQHAFCLFATLWSVAVVFDNASTLSPRSTLGILSLVLLGRCAAAWVLVRPSNPRSFLVLNAALATTVFAYLPKSANHRVLAMIIAATILASAVRVFIARRPRPLTGSELYTAFAPLIRWEMIALYFWAVVQKLNVDFFDPSISCGPAQVWNLSRVLPFVPSAESLQQFSIYGTLLVEAAIPCLLIIRRTRVVGIALAMGFHLALGAGYVGFSASLFAMLSLFAPPKLTEQLWRIGSSVTGRLKRIGSVGTSARVLVERILVLAIVALGLGAAVAFIGFEGVRARFWGVPFLRSDSLLAVWIVLGSAAIAVFALAAWRSRLAPGEAGALRPRYWTLAVMPLLVFGVGLGPHLGLKNTQAFAMFSNLKTGGGTSNHLFIPSSWQISGNLNDLVTIHESSDRALDKLVGPSWSWFNYFSTYTVDRAKLRRNQPAPNWRLPYIALRRRVSELARRGERNVRVVYERDGITYRREQAETDPELANLGLLARKFLLLRAVPDTERGYCLW